MSKFNINKLGNIILQFKIPMAFDLLDCLKKEDDGKPFIVVINNIPAKIYIERIYEFRYRNEGFQVTPCSKIREDRGGMLSHSKVQVWFDRQTFDSGEYNKETFRIMPDQFLDLSIEYLNKFIKSYRNITNEYWLRPVINEDVFNINSILIDTDNNQEVVHSLSSHHILELNGGKPFKLDEKVETYFRNSLQSDHYDFRKELLLNIQDNFSLGYYNIALLQSVTALENFVYSHLKDKLSPTKLDKIKKKEECGCMVGISGVCERGLKKYFGIDFGNTEEFKNLKEKALKYRNPIVHGELVEKYLFSWDKIPGNDDERIIKFLKDKFKIKLGQTENISRIDGGKTIIVSNKEKSLSLKLNDEKNKVNLKIDDFGVDEFTVKIKNGKLYIYQESIDKDTCEQGINAVQNAINYLYENIFSKK